MCAHVYIHQGTVALCIKIDYFYVYRMWQAADTLQYPFPLLLLEREVLGFNYVPILGM